MQGKPVTEIAALLGEIAAPLGHSSPVVTLRVYSHWFNVKTTSTEDVAAAVFGGRAL